MLELSYKSFKSTIMFKELKEIMFKELKVGDSNDSSSRDYQWRHRMCQKKQIQILYLKML